MKIKLPGLLSILLCFTGGIEVLRRVVAMMLNYCVFHTLTYPESNCLSLFE